MIDIRFYQKCFDLKQRIMSGELIPAEILLETLHAYRSQEPVIYNIETTNSCNMACSMCPRTTKMTRDVVTMDDAVFNRIAEQIRPWSAEEWGDWENFVEEKYGIDKNAVSENHFFLYIITRVVVLHGFGDPLMDKNISKRVQVLSDRWIPSYFSCNPSNISVDTNIEMFERGLDYIKYSLESVDDDIHKSVRGNASDFTRSYRKIIEVFNEKERRNLKTSIVISMIDMKRPDQDDDYMRMVEAFDGTDAYVYLKSLGQKWYEGSEQATNSIHWSEFCNYPWSSLSVASNGMAVACSEDYNSEITLGNTRTQSLSEIWNSEEYNQFRIGHVLSPVHTKCQNRCDMSQICNHSTKTGCPSRKPHPV